jgi:hypothetical protein
MNFLQKTVEGPPAMKEETAMPNFPAARIGAGEDDRHVGVVAPRRAVHRPHRPLLEHEPVRRPGDVDVARARRVMVAADAQHHRIVVRLRDLPARHGHADARLVRQSFGDRVRDLVEVGPRERLGVEVEVGPERVADESRGGRGNRSQTQRPSISIIGVWRLRAAT